MSTHWRPSWILWLLGSLRQEVEAVGITSIMMAIDKQPRETNALLSCGTSTFLMKTGMIMDTATQMLAFIAYIVVIFYLYWLRSPNHLFIQGFYPKQ